MKEPENQIFKSEIFKKKNTKMPCFLLKLRGSQKATQFHFRVSKRFFVSPMKLLPFFSLLSDCHSSLFFKESVILVFYSRLPQSYDQNTKLHKTLCLRVGSKNKENINLQSHLSLDFFFYLKNVLGACSNQATETELQTTFAGEVLFRFLAFGFISHTTGISNNTSFLCKRLVVKK